MPLTKTQKETIQFSLVIASALGLFALACSLDTRPEPVFTGSVYHDDASAAYVSAHIAAHRLCKKASEPEYSYCYRYEMDNRGFPGAPILFGDANQDGKPDDDQPDNMIRGALNQLGNLALNLLVPPAYADEPTCQINVRVILNGQPAMTAIPIVVYSGGNVVTSTVVHSFTTPVNCGIHYVVAAEYANTRKTRQVQALAGHGPVNVIIDMTPTK